jgi:hypothetical protein
MFMSNMKWGICVAIGVVVLILIIVVPVGECWISMIELRACQLGTLAPAYDGNSGS